MEKPKNISTTKESPYKKLAYSDKFKELIHDNPRIIKNFKETLEKIELSPAEYLNKEIIIDNLNLVLLDFRGEEYESYLKNNPVLYFKATINGEHFFIKKNPKSYHSGGYEEIQSAVLARKKFEEYGKLKEDGKGLYVNPKTGSIEIELGFESDKTKTKYTIIFPEFELGFEDRDSAYLVSEWSDAIQTQNFGSYVNNLYEDKSSNKAEVDRIDELIGVIAEKVLGTEFWDIDAHNMAYDKNTHTIYIFDINKRKD